MIPKRIIYCWFGGKEKPDAVKNCIATWHKHMPNWEYLEINETNFDINSNKYCKDAYDSKMWGFVADPIRLWALYNYGGVYLDTDIEVYKPFDDLLNDKMFMGFEQRHYLSTATIGAEKGNPIIKEMLDDYDKETFEVKQNWWEYKTSPMVMTDTLSKYFDRDKMEYQKSNEITIYPKKYFTNHEQLDDEVYCKHHMFGSWADKPTRYSVIIPCYNAPDDIFRRCLDSIKNQTLQPYEVICIDDASPIDTPQIAKEYGFKYIRHKENLNNGGARNTGIREATGDYLVFVNSDDYLLPNSIEEIDKVNKGQDLILIGFRAFGSWNYEFIPNDENTPYYTKLGWNGEPFHIVRRQFVLDNNLFEKEHVAFADIDWAKRVEDSIKSYTYVPLPLYNFQTGLDFSLTTRISNGELEWTG